MRAGRMKHRLRLQQATRTQDSYGGFATTWNTVDTVWGEVTAISARELMQADQEVGEVESKVVLRYAAAWAAIDTTWRIQDVVSGKNYDIVAVLPGNELHPYRRMIELLVKQGEPDNE